MHCGFYSDHKKWFPCAQSVNETSLYSMTDSILPSGVGGLLRFVMLTFIRKHVMRHFLLFSCLIPTPNLLGKNTTVKSNKIKWNVNPVKWYTWMIPLNLLLLWFLIIISLFRIKDWVIFIDYSFSNIYWAPVFCQAMFPASGLVRT